MPPQTLKSLRQLQCGTLHSLQILSEAAGAWYLCSFLPFPPQQRP